MTTTAPLPVDAFAAGLVEQAAELHVEVRQAVIERRARRRTLAEARYACRERNTASPAMCRALLASTNAEEDLQDAAQALLRTLDLIDDDPQHDDLVRAAARRDAEDALAEQRDDDAQDHRDILNIIRKLPRRKRTVEQWAAAVRGTAPIANRKREAMGLAGYLIARRVDPLVVHELLVNWDAHRNRPPLGETEIEEAVIAIALAETRKLQGKNTNK